MATDLVNLSNELAATVERAAASIVAVHARRGIGSSGIAWRDNLILTSSEGIRAEEASSFGSRMAAYPRLDCAGAIPALTLRCLKPKRPVFVTWNSPAILRSRRDKWRSR